MAAVISCDNYLVSMMGCFKKYQTKQLPTGKHCTHKRWLLVLGWVTTKEDCTDYMLTLWRATSAISQLQLEAVCSLKYESQAFDLRNRQTPGYEILFK